MRVPIDIDELRRVASKPGATAFVVKEEMGLPHDVSWISKLIKRHVGERPSRKSFERPNLMREAFVQEMESRDLDQYYCFYCERKSLYKGAIHPLKQFDVTLDDFVFVCCKCAAPGDF